MSLRCTKLPSILGMNPAKPPTSNIWKLGKIDSQMQAKVQGGGGGGADSDGKEV